MDHRVLIGVMLGGLALAAQAQSFVTGKAELRNVDETVSVEAQVEAVRQSVLASQVAGRVVELKADSGDTVKAGQLLLTIDAGESAAALSGAQAQLNTARLNYQRTQQLFQQKFVSQAAVDKAQADYLAARAAVGQTSAVHGYSRIVAPYAGRIASRQVEVGDMATQGTPLFSLFDPTRMRVVAEVPQYQLTKVLAGARAGSRVTVEIPALNARFDSKSFTVLPALDPRSHTSTVRINLPSDPLLAPGMSARAWFSVGTVRKLLVPAAAILRRSELTAVYVADAQNKLHLRQVRLGEPVAGGEVEVLAGLADGERVALDPVKAAVEAGLAKSGTE